MDLKELEKAVKDGSIDTVLLGFADMQGRFQGKRLVADHFLEEVVSHGAEACNYLLAVDVDMNTVEGYAMSSWETGYGDFEMKPDFDTLRLVPWHEGTAMCMADLQWHGDKPVAGLAAADPAPPARPARRARLDGVRGHRARVHRLPRHLRAGVPQALPGPRARQPLQRRLLDARDLAAGAADRAHPARDGAAPGLRVENSKGECNFGQHEINFTYETALHAADTHTIYKNGAKEIASQEGMAITFMAKYDEREGNSCHIHLSVRGEDGTPVFAEQPELFERFLAGQLACLREMTLFKAPNVNSYKRFAEGSFAPTAVAWGRDNRTCSMRVIGEGHSLRIESRLAGGDVNPYLAIAAMIASGLHGIDNELELEPALEGNAYTSDKPHVPEHAAGRPRPVRRPARSRARRSGRTSSTTTSTTPTWSCAPSRRPSPTGSASGASSACEPAAGDRDLRLRRARALDLLGRGGRGPLDELRAPGPGGGRDRGRCSRPTRTRRSCCGCSTGCCSPAARTSATCPSATRSSSRSRRPRSRPTCRCSASAAACRS